MTIKELQLLYAQSPNVAAMAKAVGSVSVKNIFLEGLMASATPLAFAAMATKVGKIILFVLNDADEAGYFYHDLVQIMGDSDALFFPSSYRRAVKYGQRRWTRSTAAVGAVSLPCGLPPSKRRTAVVR